MTEREKDHLEEEGAPPRPPQEDEIDLADLVRVLVVRWRWIIGLTVLAVLLGTVYIFMQPSIYSSTAMMQVGQYQTPQKEYQFIQPPQAVAEQIRASARTIYNKRYASDMISPGFTLKNDFQVSSSEQGGIIELELEAINGTKSKSFLNAIIDKIQSSHERLFQVRSQKYRQSIQTIEAQLKEFRQRINSYSKRIDLLNKEKVYLKKQVTNASKRIDDLLQTKTTANFSNSREPIGLLLFSSEIQRLRSHIDTLQTRLMSNIPEQRQSLQMKIDNQQSKITTKKAELEAQELALNNMIKTNVLLEPTVSDKPIAPNHKLYIALSLVLGAFLGVFLAFLVEFWQRNKYKILQKEA